MWSFQFHIQFNKQFYNISSISCGEYWKWKKNTLENLFLISETNNWKWTKEMKIKKSWKGYWKCSRKKGWIRISIKDMNKKKLWIKNFMTTCIILWIEIWNNKKH